MDKNKVKRMIKKELSEIDDFIYNCLDLDGMNFAISEAESRREYLKKALKNLTKPK